MGTISHPPTSSELLDNALAHQAPHLVRGLESALSRLAVLEAAAAAELTDAGLSNGDAVVNTVDPGHVLAQLAHAIDRRVYIAKKDRDAELTGVLDDDAERLDKALDQQATRVVQLLTEALQPAGRTGILRELALTIEDRIDAATRQHDAEIARHLEDAAGRIRARYDFARAELADVDDEACAGDEDPTPQLDHSAAEQAAAAVERRQHCDSDPCMGWCLLDDQGRSCAELGAPVPGDDPLIGVPVVTSGYTAAEQAQVDEFVESRTVTPGYPVG